MNNVLISYIFTLNDFTSDISYYIYFCENIKERNKYYILNNFYFIKLVKGSMQIFDIHGILLKIAIKCIFSEDKV